jgi:hypothetical protein
MTNPGARQGRSAHCPQGAAGAPGRIELTFGAGEGSNR